MAFNGKKKKPNMFLYRYINNKEVYELVKATFHIRERCAQKNYRAHFGARWIR